MGIGIIVVGAGVVGLAIARALNRSGHDVLVLDRQPRAGMEISSRNSEVIHAGLYYPEGSLRGRLCIQGRHQLLSFCDVAGVTVRRTGKLIVATSEDEVAGLDAIVQSATANGAEPLQRLSHEEAIALEPNLACVAALRSPGTAVVDTHQLALALQAAVEDSGGTVVFNSTVTDIGRDGEGSFVLTVRNRDGSNSTVAAKGLVIAGGLGATELGNKITYCGGYRVPHTYPAKGHYFALKGPAPFSHLIYPVPHGAWLGIHLTLNVDGAARFGPDIEWRDCVSYTFDDTNDERRTTFEREIRRYWPGLPDEALQPDQTGVRPKIYREGEPAADFAIHGPAQHGIDGLVALYGIESPGLTSCLAIGDYVSDMFCAA